MQTILTLTNTHTHTHAHIWTHKTVYIRIGVSTSGNDFRLGAQEAPPAIFTLYIGEGAEKHMRSVGEGGPLDGYAPSDRMIDVSTTVQPIKANDEDRNRTAPFPWCTNRFEFRAVGSNQHIALPLSLLTASMANTLREMADKMDAGKSVDDVVRETIKENEGALFYGKHSAQYSCIEYVSLS